MKPVTIRGYTAIAVILAVLTIAGLALWYSPALLCLMVILAGTALLFLDIRVAAPVYEEDDCDFD